MNSVEATFTEDLYILPSLTTVLINTQWKDLGEKEIELLSKILNSVKLSLAAVRIVEMKSLDLSGLKEKPSLLIGFGIDAPGIATYEVVATPETQLVLADSLTTLLGEDQLKKKLWISLKQLFSL
jgi:DNA polymerase III psi subunit